MEGIDVANLSTGWVTFSTVRLPTGEWMAVQKNDGRTRMILASQAEAMVEDAAQVTNRDTPR